VSDIEGWQRDFQASLGTRFVWAADELYLQSGRPLPTAGADEGFSVAEDGVGLVRRFEDGFARAVARLPARLPAPRRVTVVTGEMFAPRMRALLDRVAVDGLSVHLGPGAHEFFGRGIGVAGLLTGRDIQTQLAERALRPDG